MNFALWKHRFKKYTHILNVYFAFLKVHFWVRWLKITKLSKKESVLVILTQQFGDIVASEPLSRQIRQRHPDAMIFWVVKPIFRELLENNPNIDYIIDELCANQRLKLINNKSFDIVYNLQFRNNSHCEICNIWVPNPDADSKNITINNYYYHGNLLSVQQKIAGFKTLDVPPRLYPRGTERAKVDTLNLPKKFIVVHCQSAQNSRNWDTTKWTKLVNWILEKTDFSVVEIGLLSDFKIKSDRFIDLSSKLSLLENAEVISRAKLYIGVDSGPAHLANAVGTFGVIMIGKLADFKNHIPYSGGYKSGKNAIIVRNVIGPSADIEVEEVIEVIQTIIK
ncbi:MAG: glycosyltransferase family 9 protein [Spirosomaceae bacterium]|jgi:heptosyltransferase-3|nr:glycosyltransferase family 9 protein [Spirosomataceae bacterium]